MRSKVRLHHDVKPNRFKRIRCRHLSPLLSPQRTVNVAAVTGTEGDDGSSSLNRESERERKEADSVQSVLCTVDFNIFSF